MTIICQICNKESEWNPTPYELSRKVCSKCSSIIQEKERKTYGWFVYHLLGLKKIEGKFVISNEPYQVGKYGLQHIFINRISNVVKLEFYWGRSMVHRPIFEISLKNIDKHKDAILDMIREANKETPNRTGRQHEIMRIFKERIQG